MKESHQDNTACCKHVRTGSTQHCNLSQKTESRRGDILVLTYCNFFFKSFPSEKKNYMRTCLGKRILRHVKFFGHLFLYLQIPFLPLAGGTDSWELSERKITLGIPDSILHCHYLANFIFFLQETHYFT